MLKRITSFWNGLTSREQTFLLALVLTFFVMGTVVLLYMRGQALRETRNAIENHRMALDKVYTRGAVYQERLAAKKQRESSIATEQLLFSTLLEEAQRGIENFTVADLEEQPMQDLGEGLVKRTFEFRLRGVKLEDAIKFLSAIEGQPGRIILTQDLEISSPSNETDSLNLDVTIATWERREVGAEGEDGETEEEENP